MRRIITVFGVLTLCLLCLVSCGVDEIDISGYEDTEITLLGLTDELDSITVQGLKDLDCITKETQSTSDKIGTVRATGPLLSTVVESFGADLADYSKVIIYGEDDYDIRLNADFLSENQVIMSIGIDGEPLKDEDKPIRIIIPESDSAYWIRMVNKIEFIK